MPIQKLTKILRLESEKLEDRAVFGGLGRYAATWAEEAARLMGSEATGWVEQIAQRLRAYASLPTPAARRQEQRQKS